jgi:hypothetical protein
MCIDTSLSSLAGRRPGGGAGPLPARIAAGRRASIRSRARPPRPVKAAACRHTIRVSLISLLFRREAGLTAAGIRNPCPRDYSAGPVRALSRPPLTYDTGVRTRGRRQQWHEILGNGKLYQDLAACPCNDPAAHPPVSGIPRVAQRRRRVRRVAPRRCTVAQPRLLEGAFCSALAPSAARAALILNQD